MYPQITLMDIDFVKKVLKKVVVKGNAQFIFLYNPQKSLVNVCLIKILKRSVTKKVIVCFNT